MASSVERALRILELVAQSGEAVSLSEVSRALQIPKSTAHSILKDLVSESFLVAEPVGYVVGIKAFEVGAAHLRRGGAMEAVPGELRLLTRLLGVTSHYAVLDGRDVLYLCKEDPPGLAVRLASSVGARLPSHITAVGKASLAWLDQSEVAGHVGANPGGPLGRSAFEELLEELEQIRTVGIAGDDGGALRGVKCVAAPVFDRSGCQGAIGVSYLMGGASTSYDEICEAVRDTARKVTATLGGMLS